MFLTKKGFRKAWIMSICYFLLGSICVVLAAHFENLEVDSGLLWKLGILTYLLCVPVFFAVRYSEGEGKLINLGNKLVRQEVKPAEFIKHYEELKNSDDLVIKKPSVDALRVALVAYDLLDDRENTLATVNEMIEIASDKKQHLAKLLKTSLLFSYGEIQEADMLFNELQKQQLNITCNGLADIILKSDRAIAIGDYKIAEAYYLKLLERKVPKLDNLDKLGAHFKLGEIYEKLGDNEKAVFHYQYCMHNGGETAIKKSAIEKLQCIK